MKIQIAVSTSGLITLDLPEDVVQQLREGEFDTLDNVPHVDFDDVLSQLNDFDIDDVG